MKGQRRLVVLAAVVAVTAMAGVGYGSAQAGAPVITTPAPTGTADTVTWGLYRETATLDPIKAFDYPDNAAVALTCDALVRANPNMTMSAGIATMTTPSPLKIDFTLHAGAKFWDGHSVTSADAVFSLKRAADPKAGGFYSSVFDRVKSITAVGPTKIEMTLSKPDYWLAGELSSPAGEVVEKAYAQKKGAKFGTVTGGTMCSGPFMVSSWKTGQGVTLVPNPNYWDSSLPKPKLKKLVLIGVPDDATLTAGLETGSISGTYPITLSTLAQLEKNSQVKVYQGPAFGTDALVVNARSGPLADARVRRALSMAIDRNGLINAVFHGAATVPHALEGPGTWGSGKSVYAAAYNALPALSQNLAAAKKLIQQAGATGKTIRLGTSAQLPAFNTQMLAVQSAAKHIGLNAKLVSVSAANYFNFFSNPKVQATVDCFLTINYGDYADPTALYKTIVLANGSQNFSKYNNPQVTALLEKARGTADPDARAKLTVKAQAIVTHDMVWIPLAMPFTVVIMHKGITGAPATFQYQFGPWGVYLGAN
ncbi:MAG: ABC transporter substrate-binding protein [Actinomycetota bacterium]|nr:ABC transporter substrate-binding protein [Actinomycetota bacterium]